MQDSFLMQPEKYGKLTTCTGCRTQCRFFDMTQCIGPNGYMEPYCSTACMNSHKTKYAKSQSLGIICHFCKRNSLPQYQATMPDGKLYNFCNSSCVAKFQVCYLFWITLTPNKIHVEDKQCNMLYLY